MTFPSDKKQRARGHLEAITAEKSSAKIFLASLSFYGKKNA